MINVMKIYKMPNHKRLGIALIRYHDLVFHCDICLFQEKKLWIRMPEMWLSPTKKKHLISWPNQKISDDFQKEILNQIFKQTGLTLKKAIEIKKKTMAKYYAERHGKK